MAAEIVVYDGVKLGVKFHRRGQPCRFYRRFIGMLELISISQI